MRSLFFRRNESSTTMVLWGFSCVGKHGLPVTFFWIWKSAVIIFETDFSTCNFPTVRLNNLLWSLVVVFSESARETFRQPHYLWFKPLIFYPSNDTLSASSVTLYWISPLLNHDQPRHYCFCWFLVLHIVYLPWIDTVLLQVLKGCSATRVAVVIIIIIAFSLSTADFRLDSSKWQGNSKIVNFFRPHWNNCCV